MIELEWRTDPEDPWGGRHLYYRTWKVRIDASGALTPLPAPIEWTEWKEVVEAKHSPPAPAKRLRRGSDAKMPK